MHGGLGAETIKSADPIQGDIVYVHVLRELSWFALNRKFRWITLHLLRLRFSCQDCDHLSTESSSVVFLIDSAIISKSLHVVVDKRLSPIPLT